MDWNSWWSQVYEAAHQMSERAHTAAQKLSEAAKDSQVYESAKTWAKEIRENAAATAEAAESKLRNLTMDSQSEWEPSEEDLNKYGITPELREFVQGLTVRTFKDFPERSIVQPKVGPPGDAQGPWMLTPWQEIHARLVLWKVPEVQDLRYVLCPRRMSEPRFWQIYFMLVSSLLERQNFPFFAVNGNEAAHGRDERKEAENMESNRAQQEQRVDIDGKRISSSGIGAGSSVEQDAVDGTAQPHGEGEEEGWESGSDAAVKDEHGTKEEQQFALGEETGTDEAPGEQDEDLDEYLQEVLGGEGTEGNGSDEGDEELLKELEEEEEEEEEGGGG